MTRAPTAGAGVQEDDYVRLDTGTVPGVRGRRGSGFAALVGVVVLVVPFVLTLFRRAGDAPGQGRHLGRERAGCEILSGLTECPVGRLRCTCTQIRHGHSFGLEHVVEASSGSGATADEDEVEAAAGPWSPPGQTSAYDRSIAGPVGHRLERD